MKRNSLFLATAFLKMTLPALAFSILSLMMSSHMGFAQSSGTAAGKTLTAQTAEPKSSSASDGNLESVLAKMNQSAAAFKSAQGDFEFETYQEVVKDKDQQTGKIYFRRHDNSVDAAFDITSGAPKKVVYKDGKVRIYEPRINQVTERSVTQNKADVEAFLSLGFGASGDSLLKDYAVKLDGWEIVDGVNTARLDLTPKNEKMRQTYNKILLWIDPRQDILLKQQFFEPSGDYRLAHYLHMKLNQSLPGDAFKLNTNSNTKTVKTQ